MDIPHEAPRAERRIEFARSSTDRMLLGVCGGVARRYGVDAYVVRIALLLLTLTGGIGVVLYVVGWALSASPDELPAKESFAPGMVSTRSSAAAAATGGLLMTARNIGLWPGDAIMVPAIVLAVGSGLLWYRGRDAHPRADPLERVLQGRVTPLRSPVSWHWSHAGCEFRSCPPRWPLWLWPSPEPPCWSARTSVD